MEKGTNNRNDEEGAEKINNYQLGLREKPDRILKYEKKKGRWKKSCKKNEDSSEGTRSRRPRCRGLGAAMSLETRGEGRRENRAPRRKGN